MKLAHWLIGIVLVIFFVCTAVFGKEVLKLMIKKEIGSVVSNINQGKSLQPQQFIVRGAIPYWDQPAAITAFKKKPEVFDYISVFWYFAQPDGSIRKYKDAQEDQGFIDYAHEHGVKVMLVITNLGEIKGSTWDSDRVVSILSDAANRQRHIEVIVEKLKSLEVDGVTIDYEEVEESARDGFTSLIKDLASAVHEQGKEIEVALHPKHNDTRYQFQDWKALSKYADRLYIMAFGEHWDEGEAGPIAGTQWLKKIIKYTKKLQLPMEKVLFGIPLYGYDWNTDSSDSAEGLTFAQIRALKDKYDLEMKWDEDAHAPYFSYTDADENNHEVWYENAASVAQKIDLARDSGFGGVTFWRLGGEDEEVWEIVQEIQK